MQRRWSDLHAIGTNALANTRPSATKATELSGASRSGVTANKEKAAGAGRRPAQRQGGEDDRDGEIHDYEEEHDLTIEADSDDDTKSKAEKEGAADDDDDDDDEKDVQEVKKKAKPRVKFTVDMLLGPKGLPVLYNEFPKLKFRGKGYESQDLQTLMRSYREWGYNLFPNTSFEILMQRIEKFGSTKRLRMVLFDYREKIRQELHPNQADGEANPPSKDQTAPPGSNQALPRHTDLTKSKDVHSNNNNNHHHHQPRQSETQLPGTAANTHSKLTEEQIKIMEQKRAQALERLRNKRKAPHSQADELDCKHTGDNLFAMHGEITPTPIRTIVVEQNTTVTDSTPVASQEDTIHTLLSSQTLLSSVQSYHDTEG